MDEEDTTTPMKKVKIRITSPYDVEAEEQVEESEDNPFDEEDKVLCDMCAMVPCVCTLTNLELKIDVMKKRTTVAATTTPGRQQHFNNKLTSSQDNVVESPSVYNSPKIRGATRRRES